MGSAQIRDGIAQTEKKGWRVRCASGAGSWKTLIRSKRERRPLSGSEKRNCDWAWDENKGELCKKKKKIHPQRKAAKRQAESFLDHHSARVKTNAGKEKATPSALGPNPLGERAKGRRKKINGRNA